MSAQSKRIPEPLATCEVRLDDGSVTIVRRHGNPSGPRLVLSHGNGLAIDLYVPFWSLLLDDFDLVIHDIRNHGWNPLGALENHRITTFVDDHRRILEAIDRHFGPKPRIGVYHSLAAMVALLSPSSDRMSDNRVLPTQKGDRFKALILLDPPLRMRGVNEEVFYDLAELAAARTRRKQSHFDTMEDFDARVRDASGFARVAPDVLDLVAGTTLRPSADRTGYELRCPPEYEAQVFECVRDCAGLAACALERHAVPIKAKGAGRVGWARQRAWAGVKHGVPEGPTDFMALVNLRDAPCPIKVIGSDPALPYAYVPSLDRGVLQSVDYEFVRGTTHLLQLEKPAECAAAVRAYLQQRDVQAERV